MSVLKEADLLPVLRFYQKLTEMVRDYKHRFDFTVKYDSKSYLVTYSFDVELELGNYKADLSLYYDEEQLGKQNDWKQLNADLNQLERIINA